MKFAILKLVPLLLLSSTLAAGEPVQIEIPASRDAGFFNQNVNRNMGAHTHVPVGQTNDGRINRSVFDFPITQTIPAGATIISATFEFTVTNQGGDDNDEQAPVDFELHRMTTAWAEGTGAGNQGQQSGDGVTWLDADPLNGLSWITNGGDFDNLSLGTVFVDNEATYQITSSQLADVVQAMLDQQQAELGFLLKGAANVEGSAARVSTRESGNPATLIVNYTPPTSVVLGDVNLDGIVNLLDVAPFVALISNGEFQLEADVNEDGEVNLLDVSLFVGILTGA